MIYAKLIMKNARIDEIQHIKCILPLNILFTMKYTTENK